jgi:16S rRNA (cytidine1402-2'-O)-methyltransferase
MTNDSLQGGLYIVATPIGNLSDITLRAVDTLKKCDLIACEDTRISRKLLSAYSIKKRLISYHDHNADQMRPTILKKIASGQSVALISDAGTPLISDPGYKLVRQCYEENLPVTYLPGPSAVIAGLVLSGMPTDRFLFAGFAEKKSYAEFTHLAATLIFFESSKRLLSTLKEMACAFANREVAVVREVTKLFEEVKRGSFPELLAEYEQKGPPKGEIVLILSPPSHEPPSQQDIDKHLIEALKTHSLRDASTLVAGSLGISRKLVYARAIELTRNS